MLIWVNFSFLFLIKRNYARLLISHSIRIISIYVKSKSNANPIIFILVTKDELTSQ